MTLNKGKHVFKEVDGVRCTIVEDKISKDRLNFLKEILELNGYEVRSEEMPPAEEGGEVTYTLGVTDMVFNPVIAVYQRILRNKEGQRITPDYWNQKTNHIEPNYWDKEKKDF